MSDSDSDGDGYVHMQRDPNPDDDDGFAREGIQRLPDRIDHQGVADDAGNRRGGRCGHDVD